jgi:hypothetical protein
METGCLSRRYRTRRCGHCYVRVCVCVCVCVRVCVCVSVDKRVTTSAHLLTHTPTTTTTAFFTMATMLTPLILLHIHPQVTGWTHILGVSHMVDLANLTGQSSDVARYSSLLTQLKSSYHKAYYDEAKGFYAGGSQTAQVLPLVLGIPPPGPATASTVAQLVKNLASRGNTTSSGIVGTAFLLQACRSSYHILSHSVLMSLLSFPQHASPWTACPPAAVFLSRPPLAHTHITSHPS